MKKSRQQPLKKKSTRNQYPKPNREHSGRYFKGRATTLVVIGTIGFVAAVLSFCPRPAVDIGRARRHQMTAPITHD